ncbi:hypothetical protein AVEN_52480-1 [Araneus ventricosus]|uniref:DUF4817 domain-containing protein n=1 Tax=Araneus ventricosus TaxID=182803 RepID=A0A4Y2CZC5_ARAVE|nr:hypothetical protein AVEN_52480-1 [Araneus ventricosus]
MVHRYGALNLLQRVIQNTIIKMATVQQKARFCFYGSKSIVTVQRCFHIEDRNCPSPSKNSIMRWCQQCKEAVNVHHRKGAGRPSVADEVVERVRGDFRSDNFDTLTKNVFVLLQLICFRGTQIVLSAAL